MGEQKNNYIFKQSLNPNNLSMSKTNKCFWLFFITLSFPFSLIAQNYFFADAKEPAISIAATKRVIIPDKYKTVVLDIQGIQAFLKTVT